MCTYLSEVSDDLELVSKLDLVMMMRIPGMMLGSQEYESRRVDLYAIPSSPLPYSPTSFFDGLPQI